MGVIRRLRARLSARRRLEEQNALLIRALLRAMDERDELRHRIEQNADLGRLRADYP